MATPTVPPAVHRAGVLGSPIGHSLSPVLYRAGFSACGMDDWSFEAIECDAGRLPGLVAGLPASWAGLAVTMPGKNAAAGVADVRSERVAQLGAANTLVRRGDGWHAENTDVDGVIGALRAAGVTASGPVALLGGGGTARAVVAALSELAWDGPLILVGRRPESTVMAADIAANRGMDVRQIPFTEAEIAAVADDLAMVVSTVPAGAADDLVDCLAQVPCLFDVIYDPWPTPLAARGTPGRRTITGLDMLLHQALRQFELVTGRRAPTDEMRRALRKAVASDVPPPP